MQLWTEPAACWQTGVDSVAQYQRLVDEGQFLTRWPAAPYEESPTDCFKVGKEYWIWQPGVGGIQFLEDRPAFHAYPSGQVATAWFEELVTRSWLPAVYQLWGRQVLHASAAVWSSAGEVIAFVGPSGAGKSTIAYGLGLRPGWGHVCDDTLAFSCVDRCIRLHPLRNQSRLRPASAAYYRKTGETPRSVEWPVGPLTLKHLYFLDGDEQQPQPVAITRLRAAESYPLLLEQAHALTLEISQHNQRLMRDYLTLAAMIPAYRLAYRKSFDAVEEILDSLDCHVRPADRPTPSPQRLPTLG